jgi:hypothetical protein
LVIRRAVKPVRYVYEGNLMGRIKNFDEWKVPETLQGCISYRDYAEKQIKRNLQDNRRLEELLNECNRRIEQKQGDKKCLTQEN